MSYVRVFISVSPRHLEALSAVLFDAGAGGLEEVDGGLATYAEEGSQLEALLMAVAALRRQLAGESQDNDDAIAEPVVTPLADDWQTSWQLALQPVQLTPSLTLRPTHATDAPSSERTLWYAPRTSFGDGDHPTTRLAARALEAKAFTQPGARLLDVGCGTGVLAFVALVSGFSSAVGVDIEDESVEAATENARLNDLKDRCVVRRGSANSIEEMFPVVVANILTPVLIDIAPALAARLSADGSLLLTGIYGEEQEREVIATYAELGLHVSQRTTEDDWVLLELCR